MLAASIGCDGLMWPSADDNKVEGNLSGPVDEDVCDDTDSAKTTMPHVRRTCLAVLPYFQLLRLFLCE